VRRIGTLLPGLLLVACAGKELPPCPYNGTPDFAPSAGCLVVIHGKVLVVDSNMGGLTPPGGKTLSGESAQCAAHRETYEETGLDLIPRELLHVFDTGFHLYHCEIHRDSGLVATDSLEVRGWHWLALEDFHSATWRYQGQGEILWNLLMGKSGAEPATQTNPGE
jgi:8-oxo-dGTP diphosphatase